MGKAVRLNGMVKNPFNMSIPIEKKAFGVYERISRVVYLLARSLIQIQTYPTRLNFCELSHKGRAANQAVCLHIDLFHAEFVDSQVFLVSITALRASIRCEKRI